MAEMHISAEAMIEAAAKDGRLTPLRVDSNNIWCCQVRDGNITRFFDVPAHQLISFGIRLPVR